LGRRLSYPCLPPLLSYPISCCRSELERCFHAISGGLSHISRRNSQGPIEVGEATQQIFLVGDIAAVDGDFNIRIVQLECDPAVENAITGHAAEAVLRFITRLDSVRLLLRGPDCIEMLGADIGIGARHSKRTRAQ